MSAGAKDVSGVTSDGKGDLSQNCDTWLRQPVFLEGAAQPRDGATRTGVRPSLSPGQASLGNTLGCVLASPLAFASDIQADIDMSALVAPLHMRSLISYYLVAYENLPLVVPMLRRLVFIFVALTVTALCAAAAGPWLLYWYGLRQIDGRPIPAAHAASTEQSDRLFEKLKISQPVHVDILSPYTYLFQGPRPSPSGQLAWIIARSHNISHLGDQKMRMWHLSGAALTIWLTRNWTLTELIAKAVELESPTGNSAIR